jgi:hypothetical protein
VRGAGAHHASARVAILVPGTYGSAVRRALLLVRRHPGRVVDAGPAPDVGSRRMSLVLLGLVMSRCCRNHVRMCVRCRIWIVTSADLSIYLFLHLLLLLLLLPGHLLLLHLMVLLLLGRRIHI